MAHVEVVAVTHSDPDGAGSVSGLARKCDVNSENIFPTDYHIASLRSAAEGAMEVIRKGTKGTSLFLFDLTPKGTAEDPLSKLVKDAKSEKASVVWIDHHDCRPEASCIAVLCDLAVFGESRSCATELVGKYLGIDGVFYENLGKLVHCADFQVKPEGKWGVAELDAAKIVRAYGYGMEAISALAPEKKQEEFRHVVEVLKSDRLIDERMLGMARGFEKLNSQRIATMLENLCRISDRIAVGFPPGPVEPSEACARILEETGAGIAIVVKPEGNVSMRCKDGSYDLVSLARRFGGGGHPYAAGFQVEKQPSLDAEQWRRDLAGRIEHEVTKLEQLKKPLRVTEVA